MHKPRNSYEDTGGSKPPGGFTRDRAKDDFKLLMPPPPPPPPIQTDDNKEELLVFGYECKLYRDDDKAKWIDDEKHLIPWMGDNSTLVDRYDGRGLLPDFKGSGSSSEPSVIDIGRDDDITPEDKVEKFCDEERYLDLHGGVDELTFHEMEFQKLQSAVNGVIPESNNYSSVGYNYQTNETLNNNNISQQEVEIPIDTNTTLPSDPKHKNMDHDKPFVLPVGLTVPSDMLKPTKMKVHAIIEKTAKFIATHGTQMEIILKTKQTNNKLFNFLYHDDSLNPYYKHLLTLIKDNVYKPSDEINLAQEDVDEVSNGSASDDDDENPGYLHPSLLNMQETPKPYLNITYKPASNANSAYSILVSKIKEVSGISSAPPETNNSGQNADVFSTSSYFKGGVVVSGGPGGNDQTGFHHGYHQEGANIYEYGHNGYQGGISYGDPSQIVPRNVEKSKPKPDEQVVIEKMASYVIKNGPAFESVAASKGDQRFQFLDPTHSHHWYYLNCKKRFSVEANAVVATGKPVGYSTSTAVPDKDKSDLPKPATETKPIEVVSDKPQIAPNHANALSRMATLPPELISKIDLLRKKTLQNKLLKEQQQEAVVEKKPLIKFSSSLVNVTLGAINTSISDTSLAAPETIVTCTENITTEQLPVVSSNITLPSSDQSSSTVTLNPTFESSKNPNNSSDAVATKESMTSCGGQEESPELEQNRLKQERRRKAALFLQTLQKTTKPKLNNEETEITEQQQTESSQTLSESSSVLTSNDTTDTGFFSDALISQKAAFEIAKEPGDKSSKRGRRRSRSKDCNVSDSVSAKKHKKSKKSRSRSKHTSGSLPRSEDEDLNSKERGDKSSKRGRRRSRSKNCNATDYVSAKDHKKSKKSRSRSKHTSGSLSRSGDEELNTKEAGDKSSKRGRRRSRSKDYNASDSVSAKKHKKSKKSRSRSKHTSGSLSRSGDEELNTKESVDKSPKRGRRRSRSKNCNASESLSAKDHKKSNKSRSRSKHASGSLSRSGDEELNSVEPGYKSRKRSRRRSGSKNRDDSASLSPSSKNHKRSKRSSKKKKKHRKSSKSKSHSKKSSKHHRDRAVGK